MPKDPKKNLQRYQVQGGHLNEFEYQQSQSRLAEDSELPFTNQEGQPALSQMDRLAAVTAEAHQKVEKRKKAGTTQAGSVKQAAPRKRSSKKGAAKTAKKKSVKKKVTRTGTKNKAKKVAKKSTKRVARSSKKTTKKRSPTKRRS
jgi:hypothetical protein